MLATAVAAACLAVPASASAAPDGWTEQRQIPGTSGIFNHASATSPTGADVVAWIAGPSGDVRVEARLRAPGGNAWKRVPLRAQHRRSMQDLKLATTPDGDFWLAWEQYNGGIAEVYAMHLDADRSRWSAVVRPFGRSARYGHALTDLAVSGRGTVLIGGYSQPRDGIGNYRSTIAVRDPGRAWTSNHLSPASSQSGGVTVDAGAGGDLVAGWVADTDTLATMTVHSAVRKPGASAPWRTTALSEPGGGQQVEVSVGPSGRAAALWPTPANSPSGLQIATVMVPRTSDLWGIQTVDAIGSPNAVEPRAVVDVEGDVAILYRSASGTGIPVVARELTGFALGPVDPLTPTTTNNSLDDADLRRNRQAAVVTHEVVGGGLSTGLRYRLLDNGVAGPALELTDGGIEEDQVRLGHTATGRATVIWVRGSAGPRSLYTTGQLMIRPAVVRSVADPDPVTRAKVTGKPRAGKVVTCRTGLWVEAKDVTYRWTLGGDVVRGADRSTYRVSAGDRGRLGCRAVGDNAAGERTLTSPTRAIG